MAVKLARVGANVSLVARGPHLKAMQQKGLTLIEESGKTTVEVKTGRQTKSRELLVTKKRTNLLLDLDWMEKLGVEANSKREVKMISIAED